MLTDQLAYTVAAMTDAALPFVLVDACGVPVAVVAYKRHTDVSKAQGAVMSQYEHTCMIRGDGGRTIRAVLDRICDKWTMLIVAMLDEGRLRFTELHKHIPGISQRMLTLTLRNLERDGLVSRTVYAEVPPRVEYALTAMGKSLIPPALALAGWAIEHNAQIQASRAAYDTPTA